MVISMVIYGVSIRVLTVDTQRGNKFVFPVISNEKDLRYRRYGDEEH